LVGRWLICSADRRGRRKYMQKEPLGKQLLKDEKRRRWEDDIQLDLTEMTV
jgi:hypothetical protein